MTDRIPRPPVKVKSALPDGNLNGLGTVAAALLSDDPPEVYALVRLVLTEIKVDVEHEGNRTAILRIAALEPVDGSRGEEMAELRSERVGDNPIDFGVDEGPVGP